MRILNFHIYLEIYIESTFKRNFSFDFMQNNLFVSLFKEKIHFDMNFLRKLCTDILR